MNAKMTKIVILGRNAKKKSAFVKEIQQEMGNTVEVISKPWYTNINRKQVKITHHTFVHSP